MTRIGEGIGWRKWVNLPLLLSVAALCVYGAVVVQSATAGFGSADAMVRRHLIGIAVGLVALGVAWLIDLKKLDGWLGPLFLLNAFLVISPRIPGLGGEAGGAARWLEIGGRNIMQPSEPAKLLTILILAIVIARYKGRIDSFRDVATVLAFVAVPFVLLLLQPDLGTGLAFVAIAMGMLLVGGMRPRWFVILALLGSVAVGIVLQTGLLHEYQEDRLLVFVQPDRDPRGIGYNLQQSKIAVGSGGVAGKGLGQGTQSNLNFLPERHTDFVFAVLGEELGFLGALLLLALYLGVFFVGLDIAASSRDLFGALIVAGVLSMWAFEVLQNIGMTVGLMPITGIPLPFISFGSTFMVINLAATGMLLSVWARRRAT